MYKRQVSPNFGGEAFELDARLSFKKDGEGNVSLVPHFIRKEQKLDDGLVAPVALRLLRVFLILFVFLFHFFRCV